MSKQYLKEFHNQMKLTGLLANRCESEKSIKLASEMKVNPNNEL